MYATANGKLVCRQVGKSLPEEDAKQTRVCKCPTSSYRKGSTVEALPQGVLVAGAITKRIKEIVEHNLVQCYFRSKARESSCRLGETKTDHWGLLLDTTVYSAARAKWELKRQAQKFPWQILSLWYPIELETGNRGRDFSTRPRSPAATKGRYIPMRRTLYSAAFLSRTVGILK